MSVESSANSVLESLSSANPLSILSNRIKSRLALRRLQFEMEIKTSSNEPVDEESEDEDRSSDSESSSDGTPKYVPGRPRYSNLCAARVVPFSGLLLTRQVDYWNRPRIELLDLPVEIIEHIAVSLRDPKCIPLMDTAALYISEKYSDFSEARFSLSALSQVCSALRHGVERILYRNVQLDFTGWKGRKHPRWPAGSLRLLLRTLEARPELGRYIYTAALDYQLSTESEALEQGLEDFLAQTPNLQNLFLSQCPIALWDFTTKYLTGFATTFAPGILPSLLEHLSALKDLHLRDCHVMALTGVLPPHNMQRVRLDSSHDNASGHFARVLSICGNSVHDLDVRFIGGLLHSSPLFLGEEFTRGGGAALQTLRLDNISVLSHVSSGYAQLLSQLPVLQHLHVSHHAPFAERAFAVLPTALRTLTISHYYGLWTYAEPAVAFMPALAACISTSSREIARVEASDGDGQNERFYSVLDLQPVIARCKVERTPFAKVDGAQAFIVLFFGSKTPLPYIEEVEDDDSDPDDEAAFQDVIDLIPTRVGRPVFS